MVVRITRRGEVFLNGQIYPLKGGPKNGRVQSVLASIYPGKVVQGDTGASDRLRASVVSWTDLRGGIGVDRIGGAGDLNRVQASDCQLRYKGNFVLPKLPVATAITGSLTATTLIEHNDLVFFTASGTNVFTINSSDSIVDTTHNLGIAAVHAVTGYIGGTVYLVYACTSQWEFSSDQFSTSTVNTKNAIFLVIWDDRLWGIDAAGQLWWIAVPTGTEGDCEDDAVLPVPSGLTANHITGMFVGPSADGAEVIYVSTVEGLWVHDVNNNRFLKTGLSHPRRQDAGSQAQVWRGDIYSPADQQVYKYSPGASAVVSTVGPDKDDGLLSDYQGRIEKMAGSHNELLVAMNNAGTNNSILAWDGIGWQMHWALGSTTSIDDLIVADIGNKHRIYWLHSTNVYYIDIPANVVNPDQGASAGPYENTSTHFIDFPWFDAGQVDVDKIILAVKTELLDVTTTETVLLRFRLDYGTSFTTYTTYISEGLFEALFPNSGTPTGTVFRAAQLSLVLESTGGDTSKTPKVKSLTLLYRKKLPAEYGHRFVVDLSKAYRGKQPRKMREDLITASQNKTLVEFSFRDDADGTLNYYVDVAQITGLEGTGNDYGDEATVQVVEA